MQDHVKPDLFFAGTEFGIFFTIDGGARWVELSGGVPTIPFRDLAIQRRENDLAGASFGRGFFIFDDYSVLREISEQSLASEALLFPVRTAQWYIPRRPFGQPGRASQGASFFVAENPPFGAVFTYYLSDDLKSRKEMRRKGEEELEKEGKDTPYPGYDELELERREDAPTILLTVRDANGKAVRTIEGPAKAGFHRVAWNLRYPTTRAIEEVASPRQGGVATEDTSSGFLAPPGSYTVTLAKRVGGRVTDLGGPSPFEVVQMREGALPQAAPIEVAAFMREVATLQGAVTAAAEAVELGFKRIKTLETALARSTTEPGDLDAELAALKSRLYTLEEALQGNTSQRQMGEPQVPSIAGRLRVVTMGDRLSTYGPTLTHRRSFEIAAEAFRNIRDGLEALLEVDLPALEEKMEAAGVPWTPGRPIP